MATHGRTGARPKAIDMQLRPAATIHGRTGLSRVALDSVAMNLTHRSPCPVLVARST